MLTVANLGDSICTLVRKDRSWQKLSSDHSPSRPDEKERVLRSHGTIIRGKVQGELAVTRAFGNRELKDIIISKPEISRQIISPADDFLILSSDGLFRSYTQDYVIERIW